MRSLLLLSRTLPSSMPSRIVVAAASSPSFPLLPLSSLSPLSLLTLLLLFPAAAAAVAAASLSARYPDDTVSDLVANIENVIRCTKRNVHVAAFVAHCTIRVTDVVIVRFAAAPLLPSKQPPMPT